MLDGNGDSKTYLLNRFDQNISLLMLTLSCFPLLSAEKVSIMYYLVLINSQTQLL